MNRVLNKIAAIMLTMAVVCMIGCKKADELNNGCNNGNNGGNGGETPEAPAIVSTSEVQYDGKVFVEAVFEDETKMYFTITSPTEVEVVSGDFYYQDNPSQAYKYRGDVVIPETITHLGTIYTVDAIGWKAFYGCKLVTSVYLPNSILSISDGKYYDNGGYYGSIISAFSGCSNLRKIHMSENIKSIGKYSFVGCPCYEDTVTIPKFVTQIGLGAYESKTIVFNADSCLVSGGYFIGLVYKSAFPNLNSISFGTNVKVLPAYLYTENNPIVIEVPSSVTVLPDYAFYRCTNVEEINNLENIIQIGQSAFYECESLTSISLNSSLKKINKYTFYDCKRLTSIEIPKSVMIIENDAFAISFAGNDYQYITSITSNAIEPPALGEDVFKNRWIQAIYVPTASIGAYKTADGWSQYADVIVGI